jgi:hypothetical protein
MYRKKMERMPWGFMLIALIAQIALLLFMLVYKPFCHFIHE